MADSLTRGGAVIVTAFTASPSPTIWWGFNTFHSPSRTSISFQCIHPSTGPSAACEVGVCGYTCAKHPVQDPALIHEGIIDTLALMQVTLWFTQHLSFLFFLQSLQRHFQAKDVTFTL